MHWSPSSCGPSSTCRSCCASNPSASLARSVARGATSQTWLRTLVRGGLAARMWVFGDASSTLHHLGRIYGSSKSLKLHDLDRCSHSSLPRTRPHPGWPWRRGCLGWGLCYCPHYRRKWLWLGLLALECFSSFVHFGGHQSTRARTLILHRFSYLPAVAHSRGFWECPSAPTPTLDWFDWASGRVCPFPLNWPPSREASY